MTLRAGSLAKAVAKAPVYAYRWTLKPLLGLECRHLPTCSEYALQAIDINGAWRGGWLTLARLSRCHPWGSHGFDPPPDIRHETHRLAPWRYGRWRIDQVSGSREQAEPTKAQASGAYKQIAKDQGLDPDKDLHHLDVASECECTDGGGKAK